MDGTRHKEIIQKWFDSAVHEGGIERYDHLHVDQIDATWEPRNRWITSALWAFEMAREIRDRYVSDTHLTVVLAFALESGSRPLGVTFQNRTELENAFNSTPPSLYLFCQGHEFWNEGEESRGQKIENHLVRKTLNAAEIFGAEHETAKCIYMEYLRHGEEEYSRDVFLAG
jgi:hypothetical protein